MENLHKSPNYERSLSLDRCDIFENSQQVYPDSYQNFKTTIGNIFFKSELLLKCKLEFERLSTIDLPDVLTEYSNSLNKDLSLSLIFTGAIKSGRSSLINMLLNTKVMPTNIIGSSCCVNITHPKSDTKQISVGVHDLEGWEVDKYSDLMISDLPKKISSLQYSLAKKSCEKDQRFNRRIQVQLPHWLLKNINIYECPAIDGMYSFDEPFDIIAKTDHRILIHVIDASNGLMQWDRTFLAKIQIKWPHLPIFFIINHVDIQPETLARDRGPRFESISDLIRSEIVESESDQNSNDENASDKSFSSGILNEHTLKKFQICLIEKCKGQLKSLGFMLENKTTTRYASLSVKEFIKMLKLKEKEDNCYWQWVDDFFVKFNEYLSDWLENLLITSSLDLKSRINGIVDAARCQILYPDEILQVVSSDTYLQDIKKADNKIKEEFAEIHDELEKQITKSVKEQLKRHENSIYKSLPILKTEDTSQIIRIIKPKLLECFENVLLGSIDEYSLDDEINRVLEVLFKRLESVFIKIYKPKKILTFFQYILNLFRTLKITMVYPLMSRLPEEMIQDENKWYKEILKNAARKLKGTNVGPQSLVVDLISGIKMTSVIRPTQLALNHLFKQIQFFTKNYQEAYSMARNGSFQLAKVSSEVFKKLLLVDFVIKVIEKSFQKQKNNFKIENLTRLPTFLNDFYDQNEYMIKSINIESFTSLSVSINILCFKRICQPNPHIMAHKSTRFMDNGNCFLYYSKMDYDMLYAIQKDTLWQIMDVIRIIEQLAKAVRCLLKYHQYLDINILPQNIMLKKNENGLHKCLLFPFSVELSLSDYKFPTRRQFSSCSSNAVYQLGMVLSWLLTNDLWICAMISGEIVDQECSYQEFYNHISEKTLPSLKQPNVIKFAVNCLLKTSELNSIETVLKELSCIKEISKSQIQP